MNKQQLIEAIIDTSNQMISESDLFHLLDQYVPEKQSISTELELPDKQNNRWVEQPHSCLSELVEKYWDYRNIIRYDFGEGMFKRGDQKAGFFDFFEWLTNLEKEQEKE